MKYKIELLKDLPSYKSGTVFYINDYQGSYVVNNNISGLYGEIRHLIDKPEWFIKNIDYNNLQELSCSNCGSTKVDLSTKERIVCEDEVKYLYKDIICECTCGNKYKIGSFLAHSSLY